MKKKIKILVLILISNITKLIIVLVSSRCVSKVHEGIYKFSLLGLGINLPTDLKSSGELRFLNSICKELNNMVVFDIGANEGDYSKYILSINKNIKIFAFEPHPLTFSRLCHNLNSSNIVLENVGIGIESENTYLYDYPNNAGTPRASVVKGVIETYYEVNSSKTQIKLIKLDDYIKENQITKINLLKIDTEGNEYDILKGAHETIKEGIIDIIQFEFSYTNILKRVFLYDFYQLLKNYQFYRILRNNLLPLGKYSPKNEIFQLQNIVAVNKSVLNNYKNLL